MFAALFVPDGVKDLQLQPMQTAQCHYVGRFSSTLLRLHNRNSSVSHEHLDLLHQAKSKSVSNSTTINPPSCMTPHSGAADLKL